MMDIVRLLASTLNMHFHNLVKRVGIGVQLGPSISIVIVNLGPSISIVIVNLGPTISRLSRMIMNWLIELGWPYITLYK